MSSSTGFAALIFLLALVWGFQSPAIMGRMSMSPPSGANVSLATVIAAAFCLR
ncbi:hypothetical protein WP1_236 [Pseudomonas phage WP1]